jgi:hypothetical protein
LIVAGIAVLGTGLGLGLGAVGWADAAPSQAAMKADVAHRLDAANAAARAGAPKAAKPANPQAAGPQNVAGAVLAWDNGVFDTQEAPIPGGVITVTSMWGGTVGSVHYCVYAGASASDPAQGLVTVQTYAVTGEHLKDQDYPAPAGTGSLRIVSASGHRLTLVTGSGKTLVFDVDTRTFA